MEEKVFESMQKFADYLYKEFKIDKYCSKTSFKKTVENYCKKTNVGYHIPTENGMIHKETNLFECTKTNPENEKSAHVFNISHLETLLLNEEFCQNCLMKNTTDKEYVEERIKEELEHKIVSQERNENASIYEASINYAEIKDNSYNPFFVSDDELKRKKFEIMIEALFLEHFNPIDEDKLREDMELRNIGQSEMDYRSDTFQATKRLEDTTNYYTRKLEKKNNLNNDRETQS